MQELEEKYMRRCLELAGYGLGTTYPNPMVGCVIVCDEKIIGEGWHQKAGGPHAEVMAIASVKQKDLLKRAVLYVNLEPCSHHGRTPPCADLIIAHKIPRVVIGSLDDNQLVSGQGVQRLRDHGAEVVVGVLEAQCRALNKRFFTFHKDRRPYIILKWAQSRDGFLFPKNEAVKKGAPVWITNALSRQRVHQWRAEEASILIGRKTLEFDNPSLSVRDFKGEDLTRIVISENFSIPYGANFLDGSQPTILFCNGQTSEQDRMRIIGVDFEKDVLSQIMAHLWQMQIQSVIVEGGSQTLQKFIDSNLWDEARVFIGQPDFGDGIRAPRFNGEIVSEEDICGDRLLTYRPISPC